MEETKKVARKPLANRVNRRELKEKMRQASEPRLTISFYKYFSNPDLQSNLDLQVEDATASNPDLQVGAARVPRPGGRGYDVQAFRDQLFAKFSEIGVLGRIYVAEEGINAQISVPQRNFEAFKTELESFDFLKNLRLNIAIEDDGKSFFTLAIKVRPKIVADGIEDPDFDPSNYGTHLRAADFNRLTDDPDTILVDMRNHYESEVGHFRGAILPDVATFREELPLVAEMLADKKDKKIVMYCTGGIRCEKASAYMKYRGFENVFQLEGGIIEYARQVRAQGLDNKFIGKNFVFDERLGERISEEIIAKCHICETPNDDHTNCANEFCHILFIQCPSCREELEGCCSEKCRDFRRLPVEEQRELAKATVFNGSSFGKGVYKAFRRPQLNSVSTIKN